MNMSTAHLIGGITKNPEMLGHWLAEASRLSDDMLATALSAHFHQRLNNELEELDPIEALSIQFHISQVDWHAAATTLRNLKQKMASLGIQSIHQISVSIIAREAKS